MSDKLQFVVCSRSRPFSQYDDKLKFVGHFLEEAAMLDILFIAVTIVFFLIALAYVRGCEQLQ